MEGAAREPVAGAERNLSELQALYRSVSKSFDLRPELRTPLESVPTQFQLHEWEYTHPLRSDNGWRSIRVTTPLTWVVSYASPYSLGTLREAVAGEVARDTEAVRAFVLRGCLMHEMFRKFPASPGLLSGLRFHVEVRTSPHLGELPLVTISAPFRTFRPSDGLVALASGMTGGASFAEVLDVTSVRGLADPLRDQTIALLRQHNMDLQE